MVKEALYFFTSKPITKDFVNCCLRYILSQPIELDITIVGFFMLQYIGGPQLFKFLSQDETTYCVASDEAIPQVNHF